MTGTLKMNPNAAQIAKRNDIARTTLCAAPHDQLVATAALDAMPSEVVAAILGCVRTYDAFDEAGMADGNDPYGEHDFGAFDFGPQDSKVTYFWKIDYYADATHTIGAKDPADPRTYRVLTVMLASDY